MVFETSFLSHNILKCLFILFTRDLVEGLKQEKRHKEALTILDQYYNNSEVTISYAVECGQYKTALRFCSQYNKMHLKGLYGYLLFFYILPCYP